jgi:hypothetical protein
MNHQQATLPLFGIVCFVIGVLLGWNALFDQDWRVWIVANVAVIIGGICAWQYLRRKKQ